MLCKYCQSLNLVKIGKVNGKQRHKCRDCGKTFLEDENFPSMRNKSTIIATALDLYFDGLSVRKVQRQIQYIFMVKVSQVTIHNWINKYSQVVKDYVDSLKADLGSEWHVDETVIKVKGEQKWFWEIIDKETRFMVAGHLSDTRTIRDGVKLFREAKKKAIKNPQVIFYDGCFTYKQAFNKVFYNHHQNCKLVQKVGLNGRTNQNVIERLHGSLKDMLRARRGMNSGIKTGPMLKGWFVHYNFLRPHSALGGKTPAEVADIKVDTTNRWESLIDQAIKWKNKTDGLVRITTNIGQMVKVTA